MTTIGAMQGI